MRQPLLICLLCFSICAKAQEKYPQTTRADYTQTYARKTWLTGLQAGYSKGLIFGPNLTIQAYGGYFIANKVAIGLSGSASQEGFGANTIRDVAYSIGPIVRYQLTRTRFSPFLVASYQVGRQTLTGNEQSSITQVTPTGTVVTSGFYIQSQSESHTVYSRSFGVGLSAAINATLRIDLVLNWQDKASSADYGIHLDHGLYQPQLGINYLFGHKPVYR